MIVQLINISNGVFPRKIEHPTKGNFVTFSHEEKHLTKIEISKVRFSLYSTIFQGKMETLVRCSITLYS